MSESEKLYPLSKLPIATRPHVATAWRWATRGVRGVKLATVLIGGRRYATRRAVEQFLNELNAPPGRAPSPAVADDAEEARRELERRGV